MKNRCAVVLAFLLLTSTFGATFIMASGDTGSILGPDPVNLVGRWLRSDGGYILQFSEAGPEGRLQASYFNPRPIHVSFAAWKHAKGYLGAFVELRAPNYPGSTYTLVYDEKKDRLAGIYFHAGLQQEFQVEFTRQP